MTYTPAWNATFAKPLLNQLIAIIQRDQASAISIVNPNLAQIVEFHKGLGARTAFPWLAVAGTAVRFDHEAEVFTRHETAAVSLMLEVGQVDPEFAQDYAQDYARVLDMIVTTATTADWTTPLPITHETVPGAVTSPNGAGTVKAVWIESHTYDLTTRPEIEIPVLRVTLQLQFELEET